MAINTTSNLPAAVQHYYDETLLSVPTPNLIYLYGASNKTLKGKSGDTIRMERFNRLNTAPIPLGNKSVDPPAQLLSSAFIDAEISFYGTYVRINEQVVATTQSPVLNQATLRLGQSMKETEDELMRDVLATTATVIYATGGFNGFNPSDLALSDIQNTVKTLLSNDARVMTDSIDGSNKFGTAPISTAFMALCHTNMSTTLSNMDGFVRTYQYGNQSDIKSSEWGAVDSVRFFLTSRGSVLKNASSGNTDIYQNYICGADSYAHIALDNYKAQMIYHDGRYGGPLEQSRTAAWKMAEAGAITNDACIVNLKSTIDT